MTIFFSARPMKVEWLMAHRVKLMGHMKPLRGQAASVQLTPITLESSKRVSLKEQSGSRTRRMSHFLKVQL
jgi:hypothetical protein